MERRDETPAEPRCSECRSYFVTWDTTHPRGCQIFGFKSRELPSQVVREASGRSCQAFEPRSAPQAGARSAERRARRAQGDHGLA